MAWWKEDCERGWQNLSGRHDYSCWKASTLYFDFYFSVAWQVTEVKLLFSVVSLDKCVRNFSSFTGCSLGEAIKCATYNPAKSVYIIHLTELLFCLFKRWNRCLGIENKKGTLRPGAHADLVVLDKQGAVLRTWIRGKQIWPRPWGLY